MEVLLSTSYIDRDIEKHEGDVVDLPDEVALTLIERGSAEPHGKPPAGRRQKASSTRGRETR